jgi:hypothetical protein
MSEGAPIRFSTFVSTSDTLISMGIDLILVWPVAIGELTAEIGLEESWHHLCPGHHSPAQPECSQRFSPTFDEDHATALPQAWVKRKLLFLNPL